MSTQKLKLEIDRYDHIEGLEVRDKRKKTKFYFISITTLFITTSRL